MSLAIRHPAVSSKGILCLRVVWVHGYTQMVPGRRVGMDGQNVSLSEIEKKESKAPSGMLCLIYYFIMMQKNTHIIYKKKRTSFVAYERNVEPGPSKATDRPPLLWTVCEGGIDPRRGAREANEGLRVFQERLCHSLFDGVV